MASYRPSKSKPWAARRNRKGVEYFLGYFTTKEEALQMESSFDQLWPRQCWNRGLRRGIDYAYRRRTA